MITLCLNWHLRPVNHLQLNSFNYEGKLTYKQGERWISQLDWVLISENIVKDIAEFSINQQCPFNTNHAALCFSLRIRSISYEYIYDRASCLGYYHDSSTNVNKKSISMSSIDKDRFIHNLPRADTLWNTEEIDLYHTIAITLYNACHTSMIASHSHNNKTYL